MTNKQDKGSRRILLKSIAAGTGAVIASKSLPENWIKPVVDSVFLPAHAQTSTCPVLTGQGSAGGIALPDEITIDINIAIPDVHTGCTPAPVITKVTLDLDLTHTYIGDFEMSLTSPDGSLQILFSQVCEDDEDMAVTLDDSAPSVMGSACASPYIGIFNTGGALTAFNGETPNGTWVLNVDDTLSDDMGTLNNATLNVTCA